LGDKKTKNIQKIICGKKRDRKKAKIHEPLPSKKLERGGKKTQEKMFRFFVLWMKKFDWF